MRGEPDDRFNDLNDSPIGARGNGPARHNHRAPQEQEENGWLVAGRLMVEGQIDEDPQLSKPPD